MEPSEDQITTLLNIPQLFLSFSNLSFQAFEFGLTLFRSNSQLFLLLVKTSEE